MTDRDIDIVIIGAGLTGLTLAYHLQKAGRNFIILEKKDKVGGVIQTHNEDGFIFESGPNTGVIGNPEVAELFEALPENCELEIANPKAKNRWIWKKGKWNPLPSGPISAISTPLFTFRDKLRILGEPWRKKGNNPMESVAQLVERRLGKSFLKYAVDPFISGVYAGDPARLITKYALPKLYNLEQTYGSFIKGSMKKRKEPKTDRDKKASREVFSAKGGLSNLIKALVKNIGSEHIILNTEQLKIQAKSQGFEVKFSQKNGEPMIIKADKVVSTVGAYVIPEIFPFISKEQAESFTSLDYAKVVQVILGYSDWKSMPLNAFGGLVPGVEKRNILGILFTSSFFENRCPKNGVILSVFAGGMKRPDIIDMDDKKLVELILDEVNIMLQTNNHKPDLIRIFRYQKAIPQYGATSPERLKSIGEIERTYPGLILAGNIRDGIGMADRIKQATEIASLL